MTDTNTSTTSPSTSQPSLRREFFPSSFSSLASLAEVDLTPQKVVKDTDRLRGAYCSFSLPNNPGNSNPWAGFNPQEELKDWECCLHLCHPHTGRSLNKGRGGIKGFVDFQSLPSEREGFRRIILGMAWRELDLDKEIWQYPGVFEGKEYVPRFMAVYKGKRVEQEMRDMEAEAGNKKKNKRPFFTVYGTPFKVVGDEIEVSPQDSKYAFRDKEEETWWWRLNRNDVENSSNDLSGPSLGAGAAEQGGGPTASRYLFVQGFTPVELPRGRSPYRRPNVDDSSSDSRSSISSDSEDESSYSESASDDAMLASETEGRTVGVAESSDESGSDESG